MRQILILLVSVALVPLLPAQKKPDHTSFMEAFVAAVKADDFGAQRSLVESNLDHVHHAFTLRESDLSSALARGEEGKELAEWYDNLLVQLATVNSIYGTRAKWLVDRVAWIRSLDQKQLESKTQAATLRDSLYDGYMKVYEAKNPPEEDVRNQIRDLEVLVKKYEDADDQYWAVDAAHMIALIAAKIPDDFLSVYWWKRAASHATRGHAADALSNAPGLAVRNANVHKIKLDVVDISLPPEESREAYKAALEASAKAALEAAGDTGGDGERGAAPAISMEAAPNKHPEGASRDWEEVKGLRVGQANGEVDGPDFLSATHWYMWREARVDKDQTAPAALFLGDTVLENDSGKIFLHPGGKGDGEGIRLKLGSRAKVMDVRDLTYPDGTKGRVWYEMMVVPSDYKIVGHDIGNRGTLVTVKWRGASAAKGKVRGEEIELRDADGNGSFADFGVDYVIIGKGKDRRIEPLSKYMILDGLMYHVEVAPHGRSLRTKPYEGPLAPLRFEYKSKMKPEAMIVQGLGDDVDYRYDLMKAIDDPIWVVPGQHSFAEGYIGRGKGDRRETIWIRRGRSGAKEIRDGELNTWSMGGAGEGFRLVFKPELQKERGQEKIYIKGSTIEVLGSFGEEYIRSFMGPVLPEIQVRKGEDGPIVVRGQSMRPPERSDIEETVDNVWFPKSMEIKKNFVGDAYVKLVADFPPLGPMESDWVLVQ